MTILFSATFEGFANGTAMTQANSPFTNYLQGPWTYSNAHVLSTGGGSMAARCAPVAQNAYGNNGDAGHVWAATSKSYSRFYAYIEQYPSASTTIFSFRGSTGGLNELRLLNTGAVQIRNNSNTQVAVSSASLVTAGQFVRFENFLDSTNNQQQVKVFIGANVHGTTPDYDSGLVASATGSTPTTFCQIGAANACTAILHFDDVIVQDSGWVGSAVQQAFSVNAGADQTVNAAATVSLSALTSGGSGNYSYKWTQVSGTPLVTLTNSTAATTTFKAPSVIGGTTLTFEIDATDIGNNATQSDQIVVHVNGATLGRFFTEYFESGSDGTVITSSNTSVNGAITGSPTFSKDISPPQGLLSAKFSVGATSANSYLTPFATITPPGPYFFRGYFYLTTLPNNSLYLISWQNGGSVAGFRVNTDGTLAMRNAQTAVWTSTQKLAAGRWYRIEHRVDSTAQQQELRVYSTVNLNGTTADFVSGVQTFTGAQPVSVLVGMTTAQVNTTFYMDAIALANDTWIGATANPNTFNVPPTCNAGTDQTAVEPWATVTLTGTDSDQDGNIVVRKWTQLSGSIVTLVNSSSAICTYTAPATLSGDTAQFRYQVTDDQGAISTSTVNITTLPVTERAVINGVEVPAQLKHVTA